jgi:hypothetical protein
VRRLITGGLAEVGVTDSSPITGLKVFRGDAGNTISFAQSFAADSPVVQWQETLSIRDERIITVLRAADGSDRVYEVPGGLRTAVHQWSMLTHGLPRTPSVPAGWTVISNEEAAPIQTELKDADGTVSGTVWGMTGSRQLRKIRAAVVGAAGVAAAAPEANPANVLDALVSGEDEPNVEFIGSTTGGGGSTGDIPAGSSGSGVIDSWLNEARRDAPGGG